MLQAWALQTYLEKQGHEVEIVNYRSKQQRVVYHKPISFVRGDVTLASMKRLLMYPQSIRPLYKKWHLFEDFLAKDLKVREEYHTIEELSELNNRYDLLICGSDQLWNTNAPDSGDAYFGNWFQGKKISYAASCGPFPEKCDMKHIRFMIQDFSAVSVRENKLCDLLSRQGVNNVEVVCDPTLLLDRDIYDKLAGDTPIVKGEYVFFYTHLGHSPHYLKMANQIAEILNLPVISEKAYYKRDIINFNHVKRFIEVGPKEFLNLIKFATFTCGDSFHLQVFSILFNKDFACFNGDNDNRTRTLLQELGLERQIVSNKAMNITPSHIGFYDSVMTKLNRYKSDSIGYLIKNIR
jgi:hypothetical protein